MAVRGELSIVHEAVASLRTDGIQDSYRLNPSGWAKDVLGVHLWSKQREITESVRDHKRTVVASCHGSGKALALDTPLPTPDGWTTMADVQPGDELLGVDGKAAKVVATTPVWEDEDTYEVVFSDGTTITCSGNHEWNTLTARIRNRIRVQCHRDDTAVDWSLWWHLTETYTTREIARTLRTSTYEHNHAVPIPRGIEGTETAFMVDEYHMGNEPANTPVRVPLAMLRAAKWQRWKFLQGLSDANARVDRTGAVVYTVRNEIDAGLVAELLRGLGKAMVTRVYEGKDGWHVVARIEESPFLHDGDRDVEWTQRNHGKRTYSRNTARMIVDVRRVPTVPTKCVQVDAPHHLYLAGREMIPTHNSMIASVIGAWWVSVHPPGSAIVITTAPTFHQVNAILWEELRKHHRNAQVHGLPLPGKITQDNQWKLSDGTLIGMGRKPADGDAHAFQGIHRPYVLVLIDEACGVPEELWTGVEAITTTANSRILAIGNPDDRDTEFGRVFLDERYASMWNRISIPAQSTPNFTGEPVPMPLPDVLVQRDWVEERRRAWTEDDPRYQSKVLAKFPEQGVMSLFGPAVLARAFDQDDLPKPVGPLKIGVDPARFGNDLTTVVARRGRLMWVVDSWQGMDTVASAKRVMELAHALREVDDAGVPVEFDVEIRVDVIGLGAGVVDSLAFEARRLEARGEAWFSVVEMNGSAAPPLEQGGSTQGYGNARAYWYDHLKQGMANGSRRVVMHTVARDELEGIRFGYRTGKMYIESKEEMAKRKVKSPDFADALVYAGADIHDGLVEGDVLTESAEDIALAALLEQAMEAAEMQISPY
jgi:hypothetical protein